MRREYFKTLGCAALLFLLNAFITPRLFVTAYTNQMGSIEAAFIGIARYASQHWNDMGWFPLWYGGIPYPDSYPPLLHWTVAAVLTLTRVPPGLAYHFVVAMVYCLGPVSLFWMAWRLSGKRECALFAGIGYSLISPSCLLVAGVRADTDGFFGARRLITLVNYGEGPHHASLCLLPFAIGMLHVALEKRKPWYWFGAALALAAVPLTNWLGAAALAMGLTAYLFAGLPAGRKTGSILLATGALGIYAYAIDVPWLSPATIGVIQANAPRVANYFKSDQTQRIFAASVAVAFLLAAWAMRRWNLARHTRFALLASLITTCAALGKMWFKLSLIPQPDRYHLEMDLFLWLAAAFVVWPLVGWLMRWGRRGTTRVRLPFTAPAISGAIGSDRFLPLALALALAVACVPLVKKQRRTARWEERPIDIESTIEYKSAKWLDAHMPGQRVFAAGSIGFWLNAFSDAPQITGGFDNGISNPYVPAIIFHVYAGDNHDNMVSLLRAYGCDAIVGGGKDSREYYHPISHVEKLRGLTELWRDGGDAVYQIPARSRSLAHAIRSGDVMMRPLALYGWSVLDPYLDALDNPAYPIAAFRWRGSSAATITADLRPEHVLSVQISWDKGWSARVGGRPVPVWSDKLGQMVVEPKCSGQCTVDLVYDGGAEGRWAWIVHRLAMTAGILWVLVSLWRRRSGSATTN